MIDFSGISRRLRSFQAVIVKSLIFGLAWYFLPAWLFYIIALILYFIPFFQWKKFFPFFIAILGLYWFGPVTVWYAFVGAVLFGWLLGIREMLLVNRKAAAETLLLAIFFFSARVLYAMNPVAAAGGLYESLGLAVITGWMMRSLMDGFVDEKTKPQAIVRAAAWLVALLMWQIMMVGFLLPLDFVYQSTMAFLAAALMIDIVSSYVWGEAERKRILFVVSMVFGYLVLVLASAPLGL